MAFALFLGVFALDVFEEAQGLGAVLGGLVIHLVPSLVIVVALAISWKWRWIGALLFAILGGMYLVMARGQFPIATFVVMSGPLFLIAVLLLLDGCIERDVKSHGST
jgi:hypothetical protein